MKKILLLTAAIFAAVSSVHAGITLVDPGYSINTYFSHSNSDAVVSYDWSASGDLYYATSNSSFQFSGLHKNSGSGTTQVVSGSSDFSGASVVVVGGNVYYNTSDFSQQKIYRYNISGGTSGVASTTANYSLSTSGGKLFISGSANWSTSQAYYSDINPDGTLASGNAAIAFGTMSGASGPLVFDSAGNLFYAAGFGDLSVYRWSAAEVAAALADPNANALTISGHLFTNYEDEYGTMSGATSMAIDENGNVYLTLTNFSDPSLLVQFSADGSTTETLLTDSGRIGELREKDGTLYVASDNKIYAIQTVPEPSTILLVFGGLLAPAVYRLRRRIKPLAVFMILLLATTFAISTPSARANGSVAANDSSIVGWATEVVDVTRGPVDITNPTGAKASFGTAQDALGAANATFENPYPVISLGDGGSITLGFGSAITNGTGADFAVFENAFSQGNGLYFCELAKVSVSSDGVHFYDFPSISLTQTATQVAGFAGIDPTGITNLAGVHTSGNGTLFDLSDLIDTASLVADLDLNNIQFVRLTDVVGTINPSYGTLDSEGHLINDPYKTNFSTGGFDLDGVGVINTVPEPSSIVMTAIGLGCLLTAYRRSSGS